MKLVPPGVECDGHQTSFRLQDLEFYNSWQRDYDGPVPQRYALVSVGLSSGDEVLEGGGAVPSWNEARLASTWEAAIPVPVYPLAAWGRRGSGISGARVLGQSGSNSGLAREHCTFA